MLAQAPHPAPPNSPARHHVPQHPTHPGHPTQPKHGGRKAHPRPAHPAKPPVAHRGHKKAPAAKQSAPRELRAELEAMPTWIVGLAIAMGGPLQ